MTSLFLTTLFLVSLSSGQFTTPTPTPTATPTAVPSPQPSIPPECQPNSGIPRPPNVICPQVGGVSGVIGVTSLRSCTYFQPDLNCGPGENATVLDVGLNPGTGNDLHFIFETIPTTSTGTLYTGSGNQCTGGTCGAIGRQIELTIVASPLVVYYELVDISLTVPFSYASFFSSAFKHYNDNPPLQCGGTANSQTSGFCLNLTSTCTATNTGIQFSQICSFLTANSRDCGWNLPGLKNGFPNWPWANSCDDSGSMTKLWSDPVPAISDQDMPLFGGTKEYRQAVCDMPDFNTECVNQPSTVVNGYLGLVVPPQYADTPNLSYPWNTPFSFNGDTNAEADADVDDDNKRNTVRYPPCKRGEVDDDADDDSTTQCIKKFGRLTTNSNCRIMFGKWFYMGQAPWYKMNPNQVFPSFCSQDADAKEYGGVMSVRPVPIACGAGPRDGPNVAPPFFPYGLPFITFATDDNPSQIISPYNGHDPDNNPCGPDDDECCKATILAEDSGGFAFVQCAPGAQKDASPGNFPGCPAQVNPTICSSCATDRAGIVTDSGTTHYTASAIGKLYPMCKVFQIRPAPNPVYTVNATVTTVDEPIQQLDFVSISNVQFATNCVTKTGSDRSQCYRRTSSPLTGQTKSGANQTILIEIVNLDTTTGQISSELNGYIVVCNQTFPSSTISMGDPDRPTVNPWPDIITNLGDHKIKYGGPGSQNGKYIAMAPWPGFLGLNPLVENNKGAWFYYVPPNKVTGYGTGCGQNGIEIRYFANSFNAEFLCQRCRNTCVPGWIPCYDWTILDRVTDLHYNNSQTELYLRDNMEVHTPCQVASYLHQWMEDSPDCLTFISNYRKFGYLPYAWVNEAGLSTNDSCGPPQYYLIENKLFFADPTLNSNNYYINLRVALAGELVDVEQDVSSGCYSTPTQIGNEPFCLDELTTGIPAGAVTCGVIQNSNDGSLKVYVKNTGDVVGDYTIRTTCSPGSGITPLAAPVFEITSNQDVPLLVTVPLSHNGVIPASATCTFNLTSPTYNIIFDSLVNVNCIVVAQTTSIPVASFNTTNACQEFGMNCEVPPETPSSSVAWGFWFIIITILLMCAAPCFIRCIKSDITKTKSKISALDTASTVESAKAGAQIKYEKLRA